MSCKTVNLEEGRPTVESARSRLSQAIVSARANRQPCLKLIHGYGSSGRGGAIKQEVHRFLAQKKQAGVIRHYVPGEEFSPFYEEARRAVDLCPDLSRDRDYSRQNGGITIVVF